MSPPALGRLSCDLAPGSGCQPGHGGSVVSHRWGLCLLSQQKELLGQELSHQSRQRFPALPGLGTPIQPGQSGGAGVSNLPPRLHTQGDSSCLNTSSVFIANPLLLARRGEGSLGQWRSPCVPPPLGDTQRHTNHSHAGAALMVGRAAPQGVMPGAPSIPSPRPSQPWGAHRAVLIWALLR